MESQPESLSSVDTDPERLEHLLDLARSVEGLDDAGRTDKAVSGLTGGAPAYLLAALQSDQGGRWLVVAPDLGTAESLCDDLQTWTDADVHYLPELEILPFDRKSPTREIQATVQSSLDQLERGATGFFVTTVYGLRHKVMAPATLAAARIPVRVGEQLDPDELGEHLSTLGYRPGGTVELPGDVALRGGLLDVWSPAHELPLRIELFGDEVESIRTFDPTDQRSRGELKEAWVIPAGPIVGDDDHLLDALARVENDDEITEDDRTHLLERLQDRMHFAGMESIAPFFHPQANVLEYLEPGDRVVWIDPDDLCERSGHLDTETQRVRADRVRKGDPVPAVEELMTPAAELRRRVEDKVQLWLGDVVLPRASDAPLAPPAKTPVVNVQTRAQERGRGDVRPLLETTAQLHQAGSESLLFCDNRGQADRLAELLQEAAVSDAILPTVRVGQLHAGFVWSGAGVAVFTDHELFDRSRRAARRSRFRGTGKVADPKALRPGDYCVHVDHGIGRFLGLRTITADGIEQECLLLEYAEQDRLYVPTHQLLLVERYDVGEGDDPQLHKLGTGSWDRTKKRARKAIQVMAQELLSLYAARAALPGHAFREDTHLQREMEASFLHEETPDQLTSIEAVKTDMEAPRPMDRLVCGDVGFGKTEVAMRAAFKCVMEGKQVAVLCPTTLLADQHAETFSQRFRDYPVRVDVLSRFRTPKDQKEVAKATTEGKVDILVGTHRILGRDIRFKDLGLLIVDEEQRFGVRHKERLKEMRKQVDVLTLTATPIPRTLYLSLMGTRDISIIATPPRERLPIHTEVVPFNHEQIQEAILREMHRGGQVFFVHNRVETITAAAAIVAEVVPQASVAIAHGQMGEGELEKIMKDFLDGKFDVLVTTTIIESGLDMPNVNTLIIDRSDRFGLSQLYQLRGRVGRSRHQAYAYLMVPRDQTLRPDARKRLAAIQEFTDLGSGYHIAMRDLEIRGAGNILGDSQHGHIVAIGFDLYCKLLEEEVRTLKGEGLPRLSDVKVELKVSALLPDDYLSDAEVKLHWYRDLNRVDSERRLDRIAEELRDRFGPPPPAVRNLLDITRIKLRALAGGVEDIRVTRRGVRMVFGGEATPDSSILRRLVGTGGPKLTFNAVDRLEMTVECPREEAIPASLAVLRRLAEAAA